MENLKAKSFDLRKDTVDIIVAGKGGHIGGDMSVIDTLMSLYFCQMNISPENMDDPDRDRFVLSKGHSVEAYYAVLAAKGFLDLEDIKAHFSKFGSKYIGHPNNKLPGIEMNSGSLGHGLPVCVGMALAGRIDKKDYRVFCMTGDGELQEGSNWEAIMAAGHYQLGNIVMITDKNQIEATGWTKDIMNIDPLDKKLEAFGWDVISIDGHNMEEILKTLHSLPASDSQIRRKPIAIISNTRKAETICNSMAKGRFVLLREVKRQRI